MFIIFREEENNNSMNDSLFHKVRSNVEEQKDKITNKNKKNQVTFSVNYYENRKLTENLHVSFLPL